MKRLAKTLAFIAGISAAGAAFALAETSPERYAEPYPHHGEQDTGTPRFGPSSDMPSPGSAIKPPATQPQASSGAEGSLPQQPRETGG